MGSYGVLRPLAQPCTQLASLRACSVQTLRKVLANGLGRSHCPSNTTVPTLPSSPGLSIRVSIREVCPSSRATWPWLGNIPECDFRPALSHDCCAMETPPSAPLPAPPQGHFPCNFPAPGIRVIPTLARAWVSPLFSLPPSLLCPSHSPEG